MSTKLTKSECMCTNSSTVAYLVRYCVVSSIQIKVDISDNNRAVESSVVLFVVIDVFY